jgi:phage terminase large subunit GpA-like protein
MSGALDVCRGAIEALKVERELRQATFAPVSRLSLSAWAEEHRQLTTESGAAEPGRYRFDRAPYLREIADAMTEPGLRRVVFKKSSRIGATVGVLENFIAYVIHLAPASMMVMQPTVDEAKGWSAEHLEPLLRDTRALRGRVLQSGRRSSSNTLQRKKFPGGYLAIIGSNSASGLRRRGIRYLLADEIDGYGKTAKGKVQEGDPLSLARRRMGAQWRRKEFNSSTPTERGHSRIDAEYEDSDRREYEVPCPHCGHWQTLKWRNFRWDPGKPQTVQYLCGDLNDQDEIIGGCGALIPEMYKPRMVRAGRWVPRNPGHPTRGYFIWSAYTLLGYTWVDMATEWIAAQRDRTELQTFVNTVLGESWEDREGQVPESLLANRRENYTAEVPRGAALLTMGVDTQGDRLEASIWAFGAGEEMWLVKHEIVYGDPALLYGNDKSPWTKLDVLVHRTWKHESGTDLRIAVTCVDSGGHHTDEVYRYCKLKRGSNVFAIRGSPDASARPVSQPTKGGPFNLGTIALKDTLFARAKITKAGDGYMHFPWSATDDYFKGLLSEIPRTRYVNRRPVRRYEPLPGRRSEPLDCAVYALAGLHLTGPLRDQLAILVDRLNAHLPLTSRAPVRRGSRGLSDWQG